MEFRDELTLDVDIVNGRELTERLAGCGLEIAAFAPPDPDGIDYFSTW